MSKARIEIPEHLQGFLEAEHCDDFPLSRYYVTQQQKEIIENILRIQKLTDEMHKMGLAYLNTTLLYGASGTGKTTFGRYIAYTLDKDFVYINFAKLIDGIFGNTARNISEIFRFMADADCIFMMDEIDCISQKRGTESSATGGEISRITVTLMQELDYYRKNKVKTIIIGATNRRDIMDEALLSRFSLPVELKPLKNAEKEAYIKLFLDDVGVPYDIMNIKEYCARNTVIRQRNVEADMIRCIAQWIESGKKKFHLEHIREDR
ncbi:MAG: ATP-binding protein [Lachnospiraceae bacterium]|nr:ATP-binding protein [Lachnospiraceae bacterium]